MVRFYYRIKMLSRFSKRYKIYPSKVRRTVMRYDNCLKGVFIERPNRFIAYVDVDGEVETCHVKNTGRCRELLIPGASVWLEEKPAENRKTKYDLVAVEKGDLLINMDSQAPNKAAEEYLRREFPDMISLQREVSYKSSRFDFYMETKDGGMFIEVKGVTLEKDGVAMFPDAPTLRGVKHIKELTGCLSEGYRAMILFIIQMKGVRLFIPNYETHAYFGEALKKAARAGVQIEAVGCIVTPDSMTVNEKIKIKL